MQPKKSPLENLGRRGRKSGHFKRVQKRTFLLSSHSVSYAQDINSVLYRSAARILYTLARRIAQDYILAFGRSDPSQELMLHEHGISLFVGTFSPYLVALNVINRKGAERFIDI